MTLEGGGLVALPERSRPADLHEPVVALVRGSARVARRAPQGLLVRLTDAGGGAGTWTVRLAAAVGDCRARRSTSPASSRSRPAARRSCRSSRTRPPARRRARTTASSCCSKGAVTRRVPYLFLVDRPALAAAPVAAAPAHADGRHDERRRTASTRTAIPSRRSATSPTSRRCSEDGAENALRRPRSTGPPVNAGVSILDRQTGARIDPFYPRRKGREHGAGLRRHAGRRQRTDVRLPLAGRRGRRVVPAPGHVLRRRRLAAATAFTGQRAAGSYVAPLVGERRHAAVAAAADDARLGRAADARLPRRSTRSRASIRVSLTIGYKGVLVAAGSYDSAHGTRRLPAAATAFLRSTAGTTCGRRMLASDFQEAKNIDTIGPSIMPNTRTSTAPMRVVARRRRRLARARRRRRASEGHAALVVAASAPGRVASRPLRSRRQAGRRRPHGDQGSGPSIVCRSAEARRAHARRDRRRPRTAAAPRRRVRCALCRAVAVVTGASSGIGAELARAARRPRLALRPARTPRGAPAAARGGDRRRVRALRRRRPRGGRAGGRARPRAAPADPAAREQRRRRRRARPSSTATPRRSSA